MAAKKARCWCDTEMLKLKAAAECVTDLMTTHTEDGLNPDAAHLDCRISALKANWVSFENSHQNYYSLVTTEQDIAEAMEIYERRLGIYNEALEKGESLQASLQKVGTAPLLSRRGWATVS